MSYIITVSIDIKASTPDPVKDFKLKFTFPNLWENNISEKVRITVAFVPMDHDNTILYLRFYQRLMCMPVLKDVIVVV